MREPTFGEALFGAGSRKGTGKNRPPLNRGGMGDFDIRLRKKQNPRFAGCKRWWWGMDSNHRTHRGQIYSLMRLATSLPHRIRHSRKHGGAKGIRTLDPYVANVMLYQLSYRPTYPSLLLVRYALPTFLQPFFSFCISLPVPSILRWRQFLQWQMLRRVSASCSKWIA